MRDGPAAARAGFAAAHVLDAPATAMVIALLGRRGVPADEVLHGRFDADDSARLAGALEQVTVADLQVVLLDYGAAVRALGGALEVVGDPVAELARLVAGLTDWVRASASFGGFSAS
jgi:hypothetical protein